MEHEMASSSGNLRENWDRIFGKEKSEKLTEENPSSYLSFKEHMERDFGEQTQNEMNASVSEDEKVLFSSALDDRVKVETTHSTTQERGHEKSLADLEVEKENNEKRKRFIANTTYDISNIGEDGGIMVVTTERSSDGQGLIYHDIVDQQSSRVQSVKKLFSDSDFYIKLFDPYNSHYRLPNNFVGESWVNHMEPEAVKNPKLASMLFYENQDRLPGRDYWDYAMADYLRKDTKDALVDTVARKCIGDLFEITLEDPFYNESIKNVEHLYTSPEDEIDIDKVTSFVLKASMYHNKPISMEIADAVTGLGEQVKDDERESSPNIMNKNERKAFNFSLGIFENAGDEDKMHEYIENHRDELNDPKIMKTVIANMLLNDEKESTYESRETIEFYKKMDEEQIAKNPDWKKHDYGNPKLFKEDIELVLGAMGEDCYFDSDCLNVLFDADTKWRGSILGFGSAVPLGIKNNPLFIREIAMRMGKEHAMVARRGVEDHGVYARFYNQCVFDVYGDNQDQSNLNLAAIYYFAAAGMPFRNPKEVSSEIQEYTIMTQNEIDFIVDAFSDFE